MATRFLDFQPKSIKTPKQKTLYNYLAQYADPTEYKILYTSARPPAGFNDVTDMVMDNYNFTEWGKDGVGMNGFVVCEIVSDMWGDKYVPLAYYVTSTAVNPNENPVYNIQRWNFGFDDGMNKGASWFSLDVDGNLENFDPQLGLFNSKKAKIVSRKLKAAGWREIREMDHKDAKKECDTLYKGALKAFKKIGRDDLADKLKADYADLKDVDDEDFIDVAYEVLDFTKYDMTDEEQDEFVSYLEKKLTSSVSDEPTFSEIRRHRISQGRLGRTGRRYLLSSAFEHGIPVYLDNHAVSSHKVQQYQKNENYVLKGFANATGVNGTTYTSVEVHFTKNWSPSYIKFDGVNATFNKGGNADFSYNGVDIKAEINIDDSREDDITFALSLLY